ncbi:uncharacterized protein MELLADRAFT_111227 [Melampsora larici-populina 98AG31]|uniref:Uncharacterized protein n=1 Tax=Melampsora larici-populina (strain 98AG31 / pathotype 3-4-7) TaxID=747676 RepID=F4S2G2_MELLP|nr:uncharacterized protein MELLADRAFT_111227 [Melampsora larici-populina 98AG31]EGG01170.1 hypothetical protein MELLADRAFT_111227 [Melampsora larici-populina 98AG31]
MQQQECQLKLAQERYILAEQQRRYQAQQQQHQEHQKHLNLPQLPLQFQQPQQAQPSQFCSGTGSRFDARSIGSTYSTTPSTPMSWVVSAAAQISPLQKETACPDVGMVDACSMVVEDDRMDLEHQDVVDENKMIIDGFEMDCVMMEVDLLSDDVDCFMQ